MIPIDGRSDLHDLIHYARASCKRSQTCSAIHLAWISVMQRQVKFGRGRRSAMRNAGPSGCIEERRQERILNNVGKGLHSNRS